MNKILLGLSIILSIFTGYSMDKKRPLVGIGVMIHKDNKILLGKRKNAHGDGTWSFPGGHLEFGESFQECAIRETLEETGIHIKNIRIGYVTNDIFENENKHYITIIMKADYDSGILKNLEPEKCEEWQWFFYDELIDLNLFLPIKNLLNQVRLSAKNPFL